MNSSTTKIIAIIAAVAVLGIIIYAITGARHNRDIVPRTIGGSQEQTEKNGWPEMAERPVTLYYYDPSKDSDASGNILCSRAGLVAVQRTVPVTSTPIQDTIRLLLLGELTADERSQGVTTEFPLSGFSLVGANLRGGVLTLEFNDEQNRASGGACRTGILWFQVDATAKQFPGVEIVKFIPEELFQP